MTQMEEDLEALRQFLPEPFDEGRGLRAFLDSSIAARLRDRGDVAAQEVMTYLENQPTPPLARVALLLLSAFPADAFYRRLLAVLARAERPTVEAFGAGWWRLDVPETDLASDIVRVVAESQNPAPLLLLQHPAAWYVRPALAAFIEAARDPLTRYSLYAYHYALDPSDIPLLRAVAQSRRDVETSALAGLFLLELGSHDGRDAIRAGLAAPNEDVRTSTYYELSRRLPGLPVDTAGYDPRLDGDQSRAIGVLLAELG